MAGRWDTNYLVNKTDFRTFRFGAVPMDQLCSEIFQGVTIKSTTDVDSVRALKVKDFDLRGRIDFSGAEPTAAVPERKILMRGDIITPFIGEAIRQHKAAIFEREEGSYTIDGNVGVFRPQKKLIDPRFLYALICSSLVTRQIDQLMGGGGVPFLGSGNAKQLKGTLPPPDVQRYLVAELDIARAERDSALVDAERLLGSINTHVLAELAILPEADNRRVFAVRRSQAQPRLDADYHSPYFQRVRRAIELSKHATRNLGELAVFMRSGFAAGRQDQAQGDESAVPHLRPLNLNAWGELSIAGTKSVPVSSVKEDDYLSQGEVLFNNTNSAEWVGKTAVFELDTPCACSNHMTRIALKPGVEPHFVAALLNAFRGIGYFSALSTFFNNQAGINTSTLAALRVPAPDFATQQAIALEVIKRKNEARRLQDHAQSIWRQARERFEQQLLQGGKS